MDAHGSTRELGHVHTCVRTFPFIMGAAHHVQTHGAQARPFPALLVGSPLAFEVPSPHTPLVPGRGEGLSLHSGTLVQGIIAVPVTLDPAKWFVCLFPVML